MSNIVEIKSLKPGIESVHPVIRDFQLKEGSSTIIQIVEYIRKSIENGKLIPETRLPPERTMAKVWGISRPTVVTALTVLEVLGFIRADVGSGRYVEPMEKIAMMPLKGLIATTSEHIYELAEWRTLTETSATVLAAERATPENIDKLGNILREMEDGLNEHGYLENGHKLDMEFHTEIVRATHNSVIFNAYSSLLKLLAGAMKLNWTLLYSHPTYQSMLVREHRGIYEAIADHDKGVAKAMMNKHLTRVENSYRDLDL